MTTPAGPRPEPSGGKHRAFAGFRLFASPPGQPRIRRATDVLVLVPALAALGLLIVFQPPGEVERSLQAFLASFPEWLDPVWRLVYNLLALWAVVLLAAAFVGRRRRVVVEAVAALGFAVVLALVSVHLATGEWPSLWGAVAGGSNSPAFPAFRVVETVVVILAVSAHAVRPLRTLSRWMVGTGCVGAVFTTSALSSGVVAGLLIGVVAAASVRLALGTPAGQPGLDDVAAALDELGVAIDGLERAPDAAGPGFVASGDDRDGRALTVRMYDRDAYTDQLLTRLWRMLVYRDSSSAPGASRIQAAEHEAVMTLLAGRAGVPSRAVVTVGTTRQGDAVLVLAGSTTPVGALDPCPPEHASESWDALALLASANLSHRQISPQTVAVVDGHLGLVDYAAATISPSRDELMSDRAALLATTSAVIGIDGSISAAIDALGTDGVAELLPYLQSAAFGAPLKRALGLAGIKVDEIRERTAEAVGYEPPPLQKLRRVTWGSLIQAALLLFAASVIASAVTNIDFQALRENFANASWGWIVAGFCVAQLTRVTLAFSTLGSLVAKLRLGPVYLMQLAEQYLALALPSSLARTAVDIRFFQRQGVPPASAVASGVIESLCGNVVQVFLLVFLLVFSEASLAFSLSAPGDSGDVRLLGILLAVVLACAVTLLAVPRARRAITTRVSRWWPDVRDTLRALRTPNKLGLALIANVATEVLFAIALGLCARGFGATIPLTELLVINISISLLASFVPVPGGIGVIEWGLTVGLVAAGMSQTAAVATVVCYRLSTFYIPPIWGFFALRWLQRNQYL